MGTNPRRPAAARKHIITDRMKALIASALEQKIGYLRIDDFPDTSFFDLLPTRTYSANRIIRIKDELLLVKSGVVEIWHTRHDKLVKELSKGAIFGDMPLLGQTMLNTKAISGMAGTAIAIMNVESAQKWVESDPIPVLSEIGERLVFLEAEHYRSKFQLADSKIAAWLLELAGEESVVLGFTHEDIGRKLGLYRETVTIMLDAMKMERLIEIANRRITILDKHRLQELSEL